MLFCVKHIRQTFSYIQQEAFKLRIRNKHKDRPEFLNIQNSGRPSVLTYFHQVDPSGRMQRLKIPLFPATGSKKGAALTDAPVILFAIKAHGNRVRHLHRQPLPDKVNSGQDG